MFNKLQHLPRYWRKAVAWHCATRFSGGMCDVMWCNVDLAGQGGRCGTAWNLMAGRCCLVDNVRGWKVGWEGEECKDLVSGQNGDFMFFKKGWGEDSKRWSWEYKLPKYKRENKNGPSLQKKINWTKFKIQFLLEKKIQFMIKKGVEIRIDVKMKTAYC